MQLTVQGDCFNNPPIVETFQDTCVYAGQTFQDTITATDSPAEPSDVPVLSWAFFGEGFQISPNPAQFTNIDAPGQPINGLFEWTPGCEAIRNQRYLFTFKAEDEGHLCTLKRRGNFSYSS